MSRFVNCTPHILNIHTVGGVAVFAPSGFVPRLEVSRQEAGYIDGIPTVRPTMGKTIGLPAPSEGLTYIVSALVAEANPDRKDLASPGELIRNGEGQPIGCKGLCVYWRLV